MSLLLLAPIPWAGRVWALPFLTAPVTSERACRERGRRQMPLLDVGRQLAPPADLAPGFPSCLVQVKSTTLGRPRTRVELSNDFRFAIAPLLCFVVLFVYGRNDDGPVVHATHSGTA